MEPENIIKSIPEEDEDYEKYVGEVRIKFMRLTPSFKIIEKSIPLSFLFDTLYKITNDSRVNGIDISINSANLKINDYFSFVNSIFKNQKINILDEQRSGIKGHPDFIVDIEDGQKFYIEFKSSNDSIRPSQLQWIGNNQDSEVWFLILEDIETRIDSDQRLRTTTMCNEFDKTSRLCERINDSVQNIESKIVPKVNKN